MENFRNFIVICFKFIKFQAVAELGGIIYIFIIMNKKVFTIAIKTKKWEILQ